MEKNNIIIIGLLLVIILLIIGLGTIMLTDFNKQDCKLEITSPESLENGQNLTLKFTDSKNASIENGKISVKIFNENNTYEYNVTTGNTGTAALTLNNLESGKYNVTCTFDGNSKFKSAKCSGKLTYTDEVTASSSGSSNPIEDNRPVNDANYKGYNPYHESEVTSDGWNPKDHEVSRQSVGDGNQKIKYDDGYFRIVDSNGYVITYGYGD
ncbi:MAG: Ig-like domain repeat protein [Methanobrevibacter sp.]|uniref:Ig-like domain-containing protein n=1 Tax=Methanobrevibacter sp. TaxID=66852 RepID=UPI0025D5BFAE|nr:Ig-like domain-containing protein [Methanobrevibacter sp.]MBQ6098763.1 Ig-like domain repeat protein [Methanobrevibacter sp.]